MGWLLFIAFIAVPVLEIYVLIQVGQVIGAAPTVALLIADSLFGAWLVKRELRRTWVALREASAAGGLPTRELADGALLLVGATLLLTPGLVTDVLGFALVLPFTRPLFRRLIGWYLARKATAMVSRGDIRFMRWPGGPGADAFGAGGFGPVTDPRVVRGQVVDGERPPGGTNHPPAGPESDPGRAAGG
jgi:UPF0716 protein FxsA